MSDQGQGNTAPPKRLSDIPEAAGIEEADVGKTKVQADEFFGMKRHDVPLGRILRTQEENDAIWNSLVDEVARRSEANRAVVDRHAKWIKSALPSEYLEKLGKTEKDVEIAVDAARTLRNQRRQEVEERIMTEQASKRGEKVPKVPQSEIDDIVASVRKPKPEPKETELPISMDAIVDAVMTEIAKRLLPETYEVRDTVNQRTAEEFGASFRKAAKALWTEWVVEREEEKAENPSAHRYNHQAVTSTLAIPVEEDE